MTVKTWNEKFVNVKCYVGRAVVHVKNASTEQALQRNASLRDASNVLKTDARTHGGVAETEWLTTHDITVDLVYAFQQEFVRFNGIFRWSIRWFAAP